MIEMIKEQKIYRSESSDRPSFSSHFFHFRTLRSSCRIKPKLNVTFFSSHYYFSYSNFHTLFTMMKYSEPCNFSKVFTLETELLNCVGRDLLFSEATWASSRLNSNILYLKNYNTLHYSTYSFLIHITAYARKCFTFSCSSSST